MNKNLFRVAVVALAVSLLSGCFLTKLVTMPMRVLGAGVSVVGAVVSVVPVVGNTADAALERVDTSVDTLADTVDEVPI